MRHTAPLGEGETLDSPSSSSRAANRPKFEIRPNLARNALQVIAISAVCALCGGLLILQDGAEYKLGGAVCLFVSLFMVVCIPKLMKRKLSFVLNHYGIQQMWSEESVFIPWEDVEKIGVASIHSTNLVGVRLKSYDNYLASFTPEMASAFRKILPVMKLTVRAASLVEPPQAKVTKIWKVLSGAEDPSDVLKSLGNIGSYAEAMLWNRQHYGYDLVWGRMGLDRSAKEFASLLEQYRTG
jgi:hypothetical protein